MLEDLDPLSPQRVDESIDDAIVSGEPPQTSYRFPIDKNARMLRDLHRIHADERQQQQQRLQRVQERLFARMASDHNRQAEMLPNPLKQERQERKEEQWHTIQQGKRKYMNKPRAGNWVSGGLLIASMLIILLGGFLILPEVLHHSSSSGSKISTPQPPPQLQPTPTPVPHLVIPGASSGKTIYTSPSVLNSIYGLAWSSDNTRIITTSSEKTQIWDATTGKHAVTVDLLGASPSSVSWSPTGQFVAVGTATQLLLIDGQTGEIVRTYQLAAAIASPPGSNTGTMFAASIPASGGTGYRTIAWSPDGRYIAGAVSGGASGYIEVLHAQDLTPAFTLPIDGNYVPDELAWSDDGQYLAATTFYTEPGNATPQPSLVCVWKLATHQITWQKSLGQSSILSLSFQPGHDYLSVIDENTALQVLEIWDVGTGQLIKSYPFAGGGPIAWSPDGSYLAYSGPASGIGIVDMSSGKIVYHYPVRQAITGPLVWSPNGKYIASIDAPSQWQSGSNEEEIVKVWLVA